MTAEQYGSAYELGFDFSVRFFVSRGARYEEAVECVQAAWARGWERRSQLRDASRLMPWIIRIGQNLQNTGLKRYAKFSDDIGLVPGREDPALAGMDAKEILEKCSPQCRAILDAYYLQGLTIAEIAASQNVSRGAVRTRLMRARQNARRRVSIELSSNRAAI